MNKMTILCAAVLTLTLLVGCGKSSAGSSPSSKPDSAAPSSQSTSGESSSQAVSEDQADLAAPMGGTLTEALNGAVGYGKDTAGVTLKNVNAAAGLMDWFNNPDRDPLADPRKELEIWYDSLDEDARQRFMENWPAIRDQAQSILDDPEGSKALLESAGVTGDYTNMTDGWSSFVDSVNGFLEEMTRSARSMMRK